MPADITDKIFGPFFTTKPRGSGLGLAIVRKIVDAHDGRIDVESRPTGGTCFRIALPLTSEHRTAQPLFAGSHPDTRTRAHDERG
ncbi:MAG TPA: hypothetical protein DCP38_07200 [Acidobacteria bacterium]|nr:hypothetical protein [Acidobacteriota bacterium]HAK55257.1 hypothetical protein [Acidobacteriota bacterium]